MIRYNYKNGGGGVNRRFFKITGKKFELLNTEEIDCEDKNMLLTAVCICLLCLLGSMQVYAAEYYGNFQYEDNGENVSIYAYNGSDKEVTIPAYINDKAVTEINDYAFLLCNSVEKIIVPSTVTTIHANAFSGAGNLKNVVLASADTKIEDSNENTDKKDTDENGKSNPSDATDNKNGHNSRK